MKKIIISSIILFTFLVSIPSYAAITYSLDNRCGSTGQIVVLITPDIDYPLGTTASWGVGLFTLSWPMALGSGVLGTIVNQNGFAFAAAGVLGDDGTNYYQKFSHVAPNILPLTAGQSYEVTRINLIGSVGVFGTFQIPASDNAWVVTNLAKSSLENGLGNQVPDTYAAAVVEDIPLFAGIFWDGAEWCGGAGTNEQPGSADGSLTCYVDGLGAQLVPEISFNPAVVDNLNIAENSQLTILPGAAMTVNNLTTISSPQGLVVASGPTGSGSFKNNPVVANTTYGTNGSVEVQIYMENTQTVADSLHIHLIGSPVYDPTITDPATPGPAYMPLGNFDLLANNTFAYRYRELFNSWINIWQPTDSIPRMGGIALSDNSNTSKVLSLTGKLNTGSIAQPSAPVQWTKSITTGQGQGLYLFSNPYACGLHLENFQGLNAARLNEIFWTWEEDNDNYGTWYFDYDFFMWMGTLNLNTANGIVGPGQGFFGQLYSLAGAVLTTSTATNDIQRVHVHTPILKRSDPANLLRLVASGNDSKDEIIIKFSDKASFGFDAKRDIENWSSMSAGATEIHTVADDYQLTVNSLPLLQPGQVTSVPMDFKCGAEATYTLTAINLESFQDGTEIWLEDLKLGGPWFSFNNNSIYEFQGNPEDEVSRFVIHFFGPTGIDDPMAQSAIRIYSYGQDAYIVNRGTETVKEYVAYDMMGRELHRGTLPNNTVNKVTIGDVNAYYIVKVITKEGRIYTDKVYINQ